MLKKDRFRISMDSCTEGGLNTHTELELIFVLEGSMKVQVEQKLSYLKSDDIFVINANKRHELVEADNPLVMRLLFDYMLISESFQGQDLIFWCDTSLSENERYKELRAMLKRQLKHYVESENYSRSFRFQADCYEILDHLINNFMLKTVEVQEGEDADRYESRLNQINNYINMNYDQPISMKDLSEKLYLSNGYLSRFFKKNYGMSFASYLTNVRILHAVDELLYTDIPVTRVAYDCGFTSASMFNKVFKKAHGVTPTEFRRQANLKERDSSSQVERRAIEKRVEQSLLKSEGGREQDSMSALPDFNEESSFAVAHSEDMPLFWGDTINFGDASNLLHSSVREHLMILKSALNFSYVRFWNIFSRELNILPDQERYDFSQIDSVLDFVQEQGMKPFIDLGLKPNVIHYEIGVSYKSETGHFDLVQWERLVKAFMRHLSTRYGQDMLDGWRIELWFDEDMRNDRANWKEYLKRFEITYKAVKYCNEKIQVGGYGIRMDYGGENRLDFLSAWSLSDVRPDFISIMYYSYIRGNDGKDIYARRSTDNDNFIHEIRQEKKRIEDAGFKDLPVYICEWDFTPSVRNYINDSTFKGAYIIKNIIDVYGLVQSMGYAAGSDRMFVSYDTPQMLFGGTGLITKEAIMKPAAFAYVFMNMLFPFYIGKSSHCLVTTDRHDNYSIVCHNQKSLNYNYYLTPETMVDKENIWKYMEDRTGLTLRMRLSGLRKGIYRLKIYRVSEQHGSVLDIWREMEYENELSRNDIKYFRRICEPNLTIRKKSTEDDELLLEETLAPNEICLIRARFVGGPESQDERKV